MPLSDVSSQMTQAVTDLLREAEKLSLAEREDLAARIIETTVRETHPVIEEAQLVEVERKIAEVQLESAAVVIEPDGHAEIRSIVEDEKAARDA